MVALAQNHGRELLGLWYDNLECSSALAIKLLDIQMGCLVSNNFLGKKIQIESDYKIAVEALLGIGIYMWRAISIFHLVRILMISLDTVVV